MILHRQSLSILGLGSILALALSLSPATLRGVPPYAPAGQRVANATASLSPSTSASMLCTACKTTLVAERRLVASPKARTEMATVGSVHACPMCGGAVTTENGKTVDTMTHGCKVCEVGTPSCCGAPAGSKGS